MDDPRRKRISVQISKYNKDKWAKLESKTWRGLHKKQLFQLVIIPCLVDKKSLKISKGLSEAMIRRTDNAMVKRKRTIIDLQNTSQKTKDWATRTPIKNNSS